MTLGCSTTFGWGVADSETYPARLQHYLTQTGYGNVEVRMLVGWLYFFQGDWLWDSLLDDYKPDVVLIGYIVQDAEKPHIQTEPNYFTGRQSFSERYRCIGPKGT